MRPRSLYVLLVLVLVGCGGSQTSTRTLPAVQRPRTHTTTTPGPTPTPSPSVGLRVSACRYTAPMSSACEQVPAPGSCHYRPVGAAGGVEPDPRCTPGALYGPSQQNPKGTVCVSGFTSTIRPPVSYTGPLKLRLMRAYGVTGPASSYELDHLVALEDGGAPADPANLWPQPAAPAPGFHQKDDEENFERRQVCSGARSVAAAGGQLALDWLGAWVRDKPPHQNFGAAAVQ